MKILHIAPIKFSKVSGINKSVNFSPEGISNSVTSLAEAQMRNGKKVGIITSFRSEKVVSENIYWEELVNVFYSFFLFIKTLKKFGKPDVIHIHDIYNLRQLFFSFFYIILGVKIFISPRGSFSDVALSRSKIKKQFFLFFFRFYAIFIYSFSALNIGEKKQIRKIFKNKKIIIIGNGSNLDEDRVQRLENIFSKKNNSRTLSVGYLGRFDVFIKGLDNLLRAYKNYQKNSKEIKINLIFIGEHRSKEFDSYSFFDEMKNEMVDPDKFIIKKAVFGEEKWYELAGFDLLALPSRSEGMPNVVLEAMSIGIPCMVSPHTNMKEVILASNSGWVIESDKNEIEKFFHYLNDIQKSDFLKKGKNAKNFLKDNLTWDRIGKLDYLEK
tara:strand:- start:11513 stop:12661 length:1149 start_codon:yes stop_codon:yes gene_type:complete